MPVTFVWRNASGPSIERSTWLSAARCITASGANSANAWSIVSRSQMSAWLAQGARYGLVIACLTAVPMYLIYHVVSQYPLDLAVKQIVLDSIVIVVVGIVLAWINR